MGIWTRLLTAPEIARATGAAADRIARDHAGRDLALVGLMDGALFFLADLARALQADARVPFRLATLRAQSYLGSTASSGHVALAGSLPFPLEGADVLLVEDIYDSGRTLGRVREHLLALGARSVAIACLLVKDAPRAVEVEIAYPLFAIPNQFVVGSGLDLAGYGRTLPDLWALPPGTSEQAALEAYRAQFGG